MFLAMHGQKSEYDPFEFHLASHLHMTVEELGAMPYPEYTGWAAYLKCKAAIEGVRRG